MGHMRSERFRRETGWAAFRAGRGLLRLSAKALGERRPLGLLLGRVSVSLAAMPRSATQVAFEPVERIEDHVKLKLAGELVG